MNPFFTFLSAAYIFCIVYLANSPFAGFVAKFNPYSLLHIPLYGILTILLLLAFASKPETSRPSRYWMAAWIAIAVAVVDEYLQSFIPSREGSLGDILLDFLGIVLAMILARRVPPFFWICALRKLKE
ncbi:MAG: VanZ family protein [Syntrophaceae bacterium]|nr:VanZ family protein [Syntrophaceae bacterium]